MRITSPSGLWWQIWHLDLFRKPSSGLVPTLPLPFGEVADLFASGAPAGDESDPSYARPLVNVRERSVGAG